MHAARVVLYNTGYIAHNQRNRNKFLRLQLQLINDSCERVLYKSRVLLLSLKDESCLNTYSRFKDKAALRQRKTVFAIFLQRA